MKPKKYFLTLLKRFLLLRSLGVFFALVIFVFMAVFPRTTLAWNPYESYLSWFDDYRNYISDSAAKIPENISRVSKKIVRILPEIKNIKTDIKMTANVAGENISANASSFFSLFSNYYNKYTSELAYLFYTPKTVAVIPSPLNKGGTEGGSISIQPPLSPPSRGGAHPPPPPPPPRGRALRSPPRRGGGGGGGVGPRGLTGPQGPQGIPGPVGPRGPAGSSSNLDSSQFVPRTLYDNQVDRILDSIENGVSGLSSALAEAVSTEAFTV